jgi:hypothetical protein
MSKSSSRPWLRRGDQVATPDGPATLLEFERIETAAFGRIRTSVYAVVRYPDGERRKWSAHHIRPDQDGDGDG